MRLTALLCDAAQQVNGKLFILGGGWSIQQRPGLVTMALAIKIEVPWIDANERHRFRAVLLTEDSTPVANPVDGKPVEITGDVEVGRPPGVKPGSDLDVPLAFTVMLPLQAGGYRWEYYVDDQKLNENSFRILEG